MTGHGATPAQRRTSYGAGDPAPPAFALVQHGHQLLITDGYDGREGIGELLGAYSAVLSLHLEHRVPLNLHLSGTLLEAIAWHRPGFFRLISALRDEGLLELVGSAYAQNILTVCSAGHALRQLNEGLSTYGRLLGIDPREVRTFWVPERVWATERIAPLLRSGSLLNGGYDQVLLDDRLVYAMDPTDGSIRRRAFDGHTIPAHGRLTREAEERAADPAKPIDHLRPFLIEDASGIVAVPLSGDLRYAIPPRDETGWCTLRRVLGEAARAGQGSIAVFGDDLERSAAVGPWTDGSWTRDGVAPYSALLEWLARGDVARPVLLSHWLRDHPPSGVGRVEPGAYFELAHVMDAGERYENWHDDPRWQPYARILSRAETTAARSDWRCPGLKELAWKQVLVGHCETAWQEPDGEGRMHPAAWVRATAAHARAVFVHRAADEWRAGAAKAPWAGRLDVDDDGQDEIVLANDRLFAVLAPAWGARLVYLFDIEDGHGRLVVGNPADDWNWQEEENRFMDTPRNHPGAFVDVGHEHDRHEVERLSSGPTAAEVWLRNHQPGSELEGAVKRFRLRAGSRALEVRYTLPPHREPARSRAECGRLESADPHARRTPPYGREKAEHIDAGERLRIEFGLSPDYLALLRTGRQGLRRIRHGRRRGAAKDGCRLWVEPGRHARLSWTEPVQREFGHGITVCLAAHVARFQIRLGVGSARARHAPRDA